jgi:tRNA A64-2'-O-ribosylphosphate transferase
MVIVDSTRAGKPLPDALSKTVPLWCAVVNEAVMLSQKPKLDAEWEMHGKLNTHPACVSSSEHEQMSLLIPGLAETLINSSFDLPYLSKPLRPFWVTTRSAAHISLPSDCLPVVCASASKQVEEGIERRSNNYTYVQGAADDHESWSNVRIMGRAFCGDLKISAGSHSNNVLGTSPGSPTM